MSMKPPLSTWISREVAAVAAGTAILTLTGCHMFATSTVERPAVQPEEMANAGGQPCPENLPIGDDPSGHGFGVERAAEQLPNLLEPQQAWLCRYDFFDRNSTPSGGTVYEWRLGAGPDPVPRVDLPALQDAIDDLSLPASQDCTADLGPRWMVVYTHNGDLTGVVVDDYGCRSVRLTDNPHSTPPGADDQAGAVGGVLDGGASILDALGVGRPR